MEREPNQQASDEKPQHEIEFRNYLASEFGFDDPAFQDEVVEIFKETVAKTAKDHKISPKEMSDFKYKKEAQNYVDDILAGSWTPEGVRSWWYRPRDEFEGRTPLEVWKENPQAVIDAAFAGRQQTAT